MEGGTAHDQATVREQSGWWAQVANLKLDFNNAANAEIRIAFDSSDGAWSYVGTDCRGIPVNQPTMNLGFLDGGTAAHEFGHAIGLAHEHQNPRGGIQWNEQVVIQELAKSPNFWDEETARHKSFGNTASTRSMGPSSTRTPSCSISFRRHGPSTASRPRQTKCYRPWTNNSLQARKMYPKTGDTTTTAVELEVNAKRRTAASIGKFGEEDLSALPPRPTAAIRSTPAVPPNGYETLRPEQ